MSRNVLESLIIILVALTFGMVLGMPRYQETQASLEELEARRTDLKNRQDYFKALAQIAGELRNYSTNLDKVKSALPMGPAAPSLANYLQSTSSQSGLILKNLNYGMTNSTVIARDPSTGFAVNDYLVSITLSGSYAAFKEFLSSVEKSSRLIEVEEITFAMSQAAKEAAALSPPPAVENNEGDSSVKEPVPDQTTYEFKVKLKARYY